VSTTLNKIRMRRFYDEVLNKGNIEAVDRLLSKNFREHEEFPGLTPTREGVKQMFTMMHRAFPDMKVKVEDMGAAGTRVFARLVMTGTHKGEFAGIKATGKKIRVQVIEIMRFARGRMTDHWGIVDQMSMMQQMGVIPAPQAPKAKKGKR